MKVVMANELNAQGNPAVVGLAGFGVASLVLQFHNVGCALCALYMMASIIYQQVFGRVILP
ncbi:MAG: succinate-acetate transporter protein [Lentimonas sp.]|jgi:succinate-acetate transporter protein